MNTPSTCRHMLQEVSTWLRLSTTPGGCQSICSKGRAKLSQSLLLREGASTCRVPAHIHASASVHLGVSGQSGVSKPPHDAPETTCTKPIPGCRSDVLERTTTLQARSGPTPDTGSRCRSRGCPGTRASCGRSSGCSCALRASARGRVRVYTRQTPQRMASLPLVRLSWPACCRPVNCRRPPHTHSKTTPSPALQPTPLSNHSSVIDI